ncbi:MAG: hypothetical protein WA771_00940 [Chthoniobacterales bacterium]
MGRAFLAFSLCLSSGLGAAPDQFVRTRVVDNLGSVTDRRISDAVLFNNNGDVVFRVVATGAEATPLGTFFAPEVGPVLEVRPPGGYDITEATALNLRGTVVGKAATLDNTMQTAFVWTAKLGAFQAEGTDPGSSLFKSINVASVALGSQDSGTFELITWNPATQPPTVTTIEPPPFTTGTEPVAINANGEALILASVDGAQRLVVWNGTTSQAVGPAVPEGFTLFPTNTAINDAGDVVSVMVDPTAFIYRAVVVRAAARDSFETFDFPRRADSVFQLRFNDLAQICFGTSDGKIEFLDSRTGRSVAFDGYRGLLNNAGVMVFGSQGKLVYWESLNPTIPPVIVPVKAGTVRQAPDVVALNDVGSLVIRLARSTNENGDALEVYGPAAFPPTPVVVQVRAKRNAFRIAQSDRFRRKVARARVLQGGSRIQSRIRFTINGDLPKGLRFRKNRGLIAGRAREKGKFIVKVAATYRVDSQLIQSASDRIRLRVFRP